MLDSILTELARCQRSLRALLDREAGGEGLGPSHLAALEALSTRPRMTGAELARAASITPQAMNEVVRRLETGGEVARSRHAVDKRKIEYELTAAGVKRVEQSRAALCRLEDRLAVRWDEQRQEALRADLSAVNRELEAELAPPGAETEA